jgi:hypothetical protein
MTGFSYQLERRDGERGRGRGKGEGEGGKRTRIHLIVLTAATPQETIFSNFQDQETRFLISEYLLSCDQEIIFSFLYYFILLQLNHQD